MGEATQGSLNGGHNNDNGEGNISVVDCGLIGSVQMPLSMQYVATLYKLFWDTTHPGGHITPSITITYPASTVTEDQYVTISWEDYDPDSNAKITLWYDLNNTGYNGSILPGAESISEDEDGQYGDFILDISDMVDGSEFYIYATISDGFTTNNSTNYTAKIIVDHPSPGSDLS